MHPQTMLSIKELAQHLKTGRGVPQIGRDHWTQGFQARNPSAFAHDACLLLHFRKIGDSLCCSYMWVERLDDG